MDTPDGRYLIVRGRLWRKSNPELEPAARQALVDELMQARRLKRTALAQDDYPLRQEAKSRVQAAKEGLGERGPVWWTDGAPDENRKLARNSSYATWYKQVETTS